MDYKPVVGVSVQRVHETRISGAKSRTYAILGNIDVTVEQLTTAFTIVKRLWIPSISLTSRQFIGRHFYYVPQIISCLVKKEAKMLQNQLTVANFVALETSSRTSAPFLVIMLSYSESRVTKRTQRHLIP